MSDHEYEEYDNVYETKNLFLKNDCPIFRWKFFTGNLEKFPDWIPIIRFKILKFQTIIVQTLNKIRKLFIERS